MTISRPIGGYGGYGYGLTGRALPNGKTGGAGGTGSSNPNMTVTPGAGGSGGVGGTSNTLAAGPTTLGMSAGTGGGAGGAGGSTAGYGGGGGGGGGGGEGAYSGGSVNLSVTGVVTGGAGGAGGAGGVNGSGSQGGRAGRHAGGGQGGGGGASLFVASGTVSLTGSAQLLGGSGGAGGVGGVDNSAAGGGLGGAGLVFSQGNGTVNVAVGAVIRGGAGGGARSGGYGINGAGGLIVSNAGDIIGGAGVVGANGQSTVNITSNTGRIVGGAGGLSALGAANITNGGLIGSGSVSGTTFTASSGGAGVAIQLSVGGTISNTAGGVIDGGDGYAVSQPMGTRLTLTNSGRISAGRAVAFTGSDTLAITNNAGGVIQGAAVDAAVANTGGGSTSLTNAGTISGAGDAIHLSGDGAANTNGGAGANQAKTDTVVNQAGGLIQGGSDAAYGVGVRLDAMNSSGLVVTNAGMITTGGPGGTGGRYGVSFEGAGRASGPTGAPIYALLNNSLYNSGTISAPAAAAVHAGVSAAATGAKASLIAVNTGQITSGGAQAVLADGGGSLTLTNGYASDSTHGRITDTASGAYAITASSAVNLNTYGVISGMAGALQLTGSAGLTANLYAGSTTGRLVLAGGADTVALYTGAQTTADDTVADPTGGSTPIVMRPAGNYAQASLAGVDFGTGSNTLVLRGAGDGSAANGAAGVFSFAATRIDASGGGAVSLIKMDGGSWTLSDAAPTTLTGSTLVSAGTLTINSTGWSSAVSVAPGATLRGTATSTAGVTVTAGTFAPGDSTGLGRFTSSSLSLVNGMSGAAYTTPVFSITAARPTISGFAVVGAAGNTSSPVSLAGTLSFTYTAGAERAGTVYTLIQNASSLPIIGTFSNAAEGSTITTGGHTFRVSYVGGDGNDLTLTDLTNAAPSIMGTHGSATNDRTADPLLSGVTVSDPDTGQAETATISFAAGAGTLTGAGAASTAGGTTTYTVAAASALALTAALQAVTFQPTATPAGPSTQTTFSLTVVNAANAATGADMATVVTVTHGTNTAPTITGVPPTATAPSAMAVTLAPGLAVGDPDAGAMVRSGQVAITGGFVAGDVLTAAAATGITAAYNAATGVLTLSGIASDAAYQQTLDTVAFRHDGTVAAGARTVTFSVTDDGGAASNTATETVNVDAYSPPAGSKPTPTPTPAQPPSPPSQQAGYTMQSDNLVRVAPTDPALNDPTTPVARQVAAEKAIAAQLDSGQISAADAQSQLFHLVDGTTSVAEISYAFFTGRTPTAAGLNYLVHSADNATDLNDPYYQQFTVENRYINFAVNLATGQGAGAAAFQAAYANLSLQDATAKTYQAVFGITPTADKIAAILNEQVNNGLGGTETRAQYFADVTGGSAAAQKAAAIGFLLSDSVKEGFGTYQQADLHFLQDLAHGTAAFNVDLLAAYTQAPTLVGQPVVDPTLGS